MKKILSFSFFLLTAAVVPAGELQWKQPAGASPVLQTSPVLQVQYFDEIKVAEKVAKPLPAVTERITEPQTMPPQTMPPENISKTPCDYRLKTIQEISIDIRPKKGELPEECAPNHKPVEIRNFDRTCYQWKASNLCTKANYFEDVQVDRYGHSIVGPTLQPIASGVKFLGDVILLPYHAGVQPPCECDYTLGHFRSGNCAPYMVQPFPISLRGAAAEAAVIGTGIGVLVP